jgi:ParB/RepB/Spo0J family partition protein
MTTEIAKVEFKQIQLEDLKESPYNPRRSFDDDTLKELTDSIKAKGILSPLLVRAVNNHFEIVGGARRYRAAKKAGLKFVPCTVRKFTDDEALEAAVIDNLQRQDVAPLEEARGYQELLKRGHKVEDLAKKTGKSERYIYARLELQKLAPAVQRALDDGKITASHAQEIARLDNEEDQKEVLEKAVVEVYENDTGVGEGLLVEPKYGDTGGMGDLKATVSIRDFKKIVDAKKVGADLVAQLDALKVAGHKAALVTEDSWYHQSKQVVTSGKWRRQGPGHCKFPAKGVLVDDKNRGKVIDICLTTNCQKHFKNHPVGGPRSPQQEAREKAAAEKRAREEAARKAREELEKKIKLEAYRQICNKVREVPKLALAQVLAEAMHHAAPHLDALFPGITNGTTQTQAKKILTFKPIQLAQLAIGIVCTADIQGWTWQRDLRLGDFTKELGINYAALEKGIRGKFAAEKREQEKQAKIARDALGGIKAKKLKAPKKKK